MTVKKKAPAKKESKKEKVKESTLTLNKKENKLATLKPHQKPVANFLRQNDISIILAEAGCSKDFVQMYRALEGLEEGEFEKIIITKPICELGKSVGFLPGLDEKFEPYLKSFYANITKIKGREVGGALKDKIIFEHIGFQRGNTFPLYSAIILSEAQNMTLHELISYVSRVPDTSKLFINADMLQSDIGNKSGLMDFLTIMSGIQGVGILELDPVKHQMRRKIITDINKKYVSLLDSRGMGMRLDNSKYEFESL